MYEMDWHQRMASIAEELAWTADVIHEEETRMAEEMEKHGLSQVYPSARMLDALFRMDRMTRSAGLRKDLSILKRTFPVELENAEKEEN